MEHLEKIQKAIDESGFKKKYIALYLGIQYDTFRRKLNGENDFKVNEIYNLSKLLKLNIKEIL